VIVAEIAYADRIAVPEEVAVPAYVAARPASAKCAQVRRSAPIRAYRIHDTYQNNDKINIVSCVCGERDLVVCARCAP